MTENQQNIKIAIIGCGAVTERCHLPAIEKTEGAEVSVLVDINQEQAQKLAENYDVPLVSNNYQTAIGQADAAIIALPHHLHASVSSQLLEAGLHILVEKPMAMTSLDCQQMITAAEKTNTVLAVGQMRRFLRSARFTHWVLKQSLLGQIQEFDIQEGNVYNWPVKSDFFFKPETAGGGVLFDTGAHTLDLMLWWLGEVADFTYYDDSYGGVEADCEIYLTMKNGAKGVVKLSRTHNLSNKAIIKGEKGIIETELRRNAFKLSSYDNQYGLTGLGFIDDLSTAVEQPFTSLFEPQIQDWLEAIRGEHPPAAPGTEAIRTVQLMEACYAQRQRLEFPWVNTINATNVEG